MAALNVCIRLRATCFAVPVAPKSAQISNIRSMATVKQMLGKRPPLPRSDFRHKEWEPGPVEAPRLATHFRSSVEPDMLLMLFRHDKLKDREQQKAAAAEPRLFRPWDGSEPWHANTPNRIVGGRRPVLPLPPFIDFKNLPKLRNVTLQIFSRDILQGGSIGRRHLLTSHMLLLLLTGRRPETVKAKHNVAPWKLREGMPCGARVTVTGVPMYNFLQNLVELCLPQVKDFEGLKVNSVDPCGNVSLGLTPLAVQYFPEVQSTFDQFPTRLPGININITTTAKQKCDGLLLLSSFLPFRMPEKSSQSSVRPVES